MNSGEFDKNKLASLVLISKLQTDNDTKDETIKQLQSRINELESQLKLRDFMIENELCEDDMKNDITKPINF